MGVALALLIFLPVLIYLLWALAIVCDDWLVPALESICDELALTPEAASATFLAFGSSAPELSINIFGAIIACRRICQCSLAFRLLDLVGCA